MAEYYPLSSLLPLLVRSKPMDSRCMADAMTLLLLIAMILAPVGLLTALATRCAPQTPGAERAPRHIPANHRYPGQPIR
jgi:hypothetical protein